MQQDEKILADIENGGISDRNKCEVAYSIYKEFLNNPGQVTRVLMDYDDVADEIYLVITRNDRTSICLPSSIHDSLDLRKVEHFRMKTLPDGEIKPPNP